jgi:LCP family protein required for cell wall assembly
MKGLQSRRMRIFAWVTVGVVAVLVAAGLTVAFAVHAKLAGITHITRIDKGKPPPKYTNALNILLIGSDSRSGHNAAIGGSVGCDCSDTLMIAHISPGRQSATVVSIPRDTVVPYYACSAWRGLPGQQADAYSVERINATLANGGPECVRETVEQQTGIYIDYVIELNFLGFQRAINDIGGVNVCVPVAIHNPVTPTEGSGLELSAGEHHINGKVALEFWRTRDNIADGSDIARIARDQYLMAQIVKGVLHSGLLSSPTKMYNVLGDLASAMTTDAPDTELLHILLSLHGIAPKSIQFITAPWASYPYDPNEVIFAQPQANAVFWAIAHDTALPAPSRRGGSSGSVRSGGHKHGAGASASPSGAASADATARPDTGASPDASASPAVTPGASPSPGSTTSPAISPANVKVEVLEGAGGSYRASRAATALTSRGFDVLGTGYAATTRHVKTLVEYSRAADLPAADLLMQQFNTVKLRRVAGLQAGTVQVVLGSTFTALAPPVPTSQSSLNSLSTSYGGINASVTCRNSAFYGPFDPAPSKPAACAC